MRILLTGKTGQVGWELQRTLAPLGRVVAVDRHGMNLEDPDSIRNAIRTIRPDLIVNPAAHTAVDRAEREPDRAMAINSTAPGIIAEEAKRLGAAVVHYSTDYVFDGAGTAPYRETASACPLSVYGKTKLAGEDAIRASGVNHLILRTSWVYGARGSNFLLTMLRLAQERTQLGIVADQAGAPTWSRMIAEASAQILARLDHGQGALGRLAEVGGTYHMTAAGRTTWHGFAQAILHRGPGPHAVAVDPIATDDYPLPAPRPAYSLLDNGKLLATFGVELPPWDDSLALCLADMGKS